MVTDDYKVKTDHIDQVGMMSAAGADLFSNVSDKVKAEITRRIPYTFSLVLIVF